VTADPDEELKRHWPDRWAKANDSRPGRSKRRNRLRRAFAGFKADLRFKATNPDANCGNCKHYKPLPFASSKWTHHCEIESDFAGYSCTKINYVCSRWKPQ
jgi:hypothetical protein